MKRLVAFGLFLVLFVGLLAGCTPAPAQPPQSPAATPSAPAAVQYPLTIQDSLGRTVTIPKHPERILSLAPSNTEILFALGLGDKVVGTDNFSDYPDDAKSKEKVGGLTDPNPEKMVALNPDVAFAIGGAEKQYAKLVEIGVPVVVLQPKDLAEVYASIRLAGKVAGVPDAAEALATDMQRRVTAVNEKTKDLPESQRPKVFYEVWNDPLMSVGPGSFIHDLIGLAGGRNIAAATGQAYPQVSPELLVAEDPAVILSPSEDFLSAVRSGGYPAWSGVTAIQKGRLIKVNDNMFSRPGPRLVDALEQLARILHPELFQ